MDHRSSPVTTSHHSSDRRNILLHRLQPANWRPDMYGIMIGDFRDSPQAPVAGTEEVLQLIVRNKHSVRYWVFDIHMLASALLRPDVRLWIATSACMQAARLLVALEP